MAVITPVRDATAQRRARWNGQLGAAYEDVLDHLRNIRRGFSICDSWGRVETISMPWGWIETDNHGNPKGSNYRKEVAVHEAGHCVSALIVGSYPTKARVHSSKSAKRSGYTETLSPIDGHSVEEVMRSVEFAGFTRDQAMLAASCYVIELFAGVEAAMHVGGLPHAARLGFEDEWKVRNILDVIPGLDECNLRSLATALVIYYADAVKAVALELHEKSVLQTNEIVTEAVNGFGPGFRLHPRVRRTLEVGPR